MSDILLPKTFEDLEEFCSNSKKKRIILSERETFPVYKMKIFKEYGFRSGIQINIYRKKESYKERYEEFFKIRYNDMSRGIMRYQVGIFYLPLMYDEDDPRNEFVPALVFDKDKSIYDDHYTSYFDEGAILQDLLIKLLNNT